MFGREDPEISQILTGGFGLSEEEEGKRCYGSSAVSGNYQVCFGCGDAETVAGKPVVYSNNCFLEETLGSLVISGFGVDSKIICE